MTNIKSPIDHLTITPSDYEKALIFYDLALAPLGITRVMPKKDSCGFGIDRPFFWLSAPDNKHAPSKGVHIAFSASSKEEVDTFHIIALKAGGIDHGAPGYRTKYHAGYYAAFVYDLDGNNIEVVYRDLNMV